MLHTNAPGVGRHVDPPACRPDLETAVVVLAQDRQEPVVGVLAHAPLVVVLTRSRGIGEDPEQDRRIGGQLAREPVGGQAERERDTAHDGVAELCHRVEVREHRFAQRGRPPREEVGTVERNAGANARIVGAELGSEVDALLAIGYSRRELAADGKPTAPRGRRVTSRSRPSRPRRARRTHARARRAAFAARDRRRARRSRRSRCRGTRHRSRPRPRARRRVR